ncbi:MAG: F0F1 ATP synthase subunit epsilon [Candidatus Riflebacteria bacterium]|nr:F0F1 ATP synthase subunit epsilon [Candidatus Riflebacteria bacterium]
MHLKIMLPAKIFLEEFDVIRLLVETTRGNFGFLPRRLDCVLSIVPGILVYETKKNGVKHIAVDEGIMVKTGFNILISVRNALGGYEPGALRKSYLNDLSVIRERERDVRLAIAHLESDFMRRLVEVSQKE